MADLGASADGASPAQLDELRKFRTLVERLDEHGKTAPPAQFEPVPGDERVLERRNPHERDVRVSFEPIEHKYTVDGVEVDISVSGLWGREFDHFEPTKTIERWFPNWCTKPTNKYYPLLEYLQEKGMDDGSRKRGIAEMWSANGELQSGLGTLMHEQIEKFLNDGSPLESFGEWVAKALDGRMPPELIQFQEWLKEEVVPLGWEPYRTEWSVFDEDACVAGQIDSLWRTPDGKFVMVDWKRCKDRIHEDERNRFTPWGNGLCSTIPNTNYGHYSVQQNAYAYLLEKRYGVRVETMYLAQFHPNQKEYNFVKVRDLRPIVHQLFERRIQEIRRRDAPKASDPPKPIDSGVPGSDTSSPNKRLRVA